ncbi:MULTISPECIES: diguanylate cyclase [unclassified Guyparkeria]|uniref:diguanylate cyclase n=1 Tax=unclassified Guyparkeria TaxID=2626246 RepID=UPI00073363E7|nr:MULTISPECIES: diguanylate cyclase [unclassified Guyparkeria]KTG17538.1 serine/threonine protein kinase [Guyparkeria sp. XI15]OAE88353.1 serine/threonine protein kinase [Guyparkeria sp. WRN-7]
MHGNEPDLPGYEIGPVLRRGRERIVYQARQSEWGHPVVVETLATPFPSRRQVADIRRDGHLSRRLADVAGVLKVHAVLAQGSGNVALITEPVVHTAADRLAGRDGRGLPLTEALSIGKRLAEILDTLHARRIVHKSVTPENVRLDPVDDSLRLAGFGIASELERERQAGLERGLEAQLPYLSPEQTGRMNRELDYRSDYYSLGVTLFELLTGKLPFQADSALEWVHQHISRKPLPPESLAPDIPAAVSAIVLKLLAKNPDERYQSGHGLGQDLQHCIEAIDAGDTLQNFVAGADDQTLRFTFPQALYGRERELDVLGELFESAADGGNELCLVHGFSGVGKSALVNEIDRPLVRQRGFFAQGKFDQFHTASYGALVDTLRSLVRQLLAESETRLGEWRERLNHALAPNASLVTELVPELELIIGPQPAVADLPPAEARNRRQIVLVNFIREFASADHPLVLFLDDLQWSDGPTRDLIAQLALSRDLNHILLIGAYRSNEVGPGHPLRLMLDRIRASRSVRDLPVRPLTREPVHRLVADTLSADDDRVRPLSDLIYSKAQGNPFFTNELLQTLHEEGIIHPAPNGESWHWDLDAAIWSGFSDDIVAFMVTTLGKLPGETRHALQLAACIGSTFDLQTLAIISERTPDEVANALMPALRQHMVVPLHSEYRLVGRTGGSTEGTPANSDWNPAYRFVHDRVQQAAYALSDTRHMEGVHLSIGRLMRHHAGENPDGDRLMEIVRHLNAGQALITVPDEQLSLARLNLRAGRRAHRVAAYETALELLETGWQLLPAQAWSTHTDLAIDLGREIQQCAYLTGRQDDAEKWTDTLLRAARNDLERVEFLSTRTRQYATLGRMDDSIQTAVEGLSLLGMPVDGDPSDAMVADERDRIITNRAGRDPVELVEAPAVADRSVLLAMRLLMEIFPAAFLSGSGNLFPFLVLRAVNLSLRHGNCPESAFAYAAYGMLLCGQLDEPAVGHEYGRIGLAINERFDDIALRARVIYVYAMFVHHWNEHWSTLTPWFQRGIEAGYQSGDLLYLAYSAQDCVIWDPTLDLPEATRRHEENLEIVRECDYRDSLDSATLFLQMQYALQGDTVDTCALSDERFDESACLAGMHDRQFMTGVANYHIYKAEICFLHGQAERALEHLEDQSRLIRSAMSLPQLVRFYLIDFLANISVFPERALRPNDAVHQRVHRDHERIRRWADNCPENFRHLQYLMEAELSVVADRQPDAVMEGFDKAIATAGENGFRRDEAMACERAGAYLTRRGRDRAAEGYLRAAHRLYARWGAKRKTAQLETTYPVLREITTTVSRGGLDHFDLDLASIMKASRAISGEIHTESLLRTTMDILLENAAGQWACLVRHEDGQPYVETVGGDLPEPTDDLPHHACTVDATGRTVPLPLTLLSHVLASGETVVLDDAGAAGPYTEDPCIRARRPLSVLCVPIRRERQFGALYMENNLTTGAFTRDRAEVVRLLAAQAAVALENARLYEQIQEYSHTLEARVAERTERLEQLNSKLQNLAEHDELTGLANRRRGSEYLRETWNALRRERSPLSVILFDVDHFKLYNDNYGHPMGDRCLKVIAETVQSTLKRPADLAIRYGGEEFMLVLPRTDARGAATVAEHLRRAVEERKLPHAHSPTETMVTISVGVTTCIPTEEDGENRLIDTADVALYQAKRNGRNRVAAGPALRDDLHAPS